MRPTCADKIIREFLLEHDVVVLAGRRVSLNRPGLLTVFGLGGGLGSSERRTVRLTGRTGSAASPVVPDGPGPPPPEHQHADQDDHGREDARQEHDDRVRAAASLIGPPVLLRSQHHRHASKD